MDKVLVCLVRVCSCVHACVHDCIFPKVARPLVVQIANNPTRGPTDKRQKPKANLFRLTF